MARLPFPSHTLTANRRRIWLNQDMKRKDHSGHPGTAILPKRLYARVRCKVLTFPGQYEMFKENGAVAP
jgi:hypothetical protein